jgi:RHS repeat-associated protein
MLTNYRGDLSSLIDLATKSSTLYCYEAYGLESTSSEINNSWRYASKHYDEETGFVYFGERFYDPSLTRWINPDPAGFIDGLNTYAYVGNNPLRFFDAYGLSDEDLHSLPNAHRPMDRSPSSSSWQGIKNDLRDTARDCTVAFLDSYINPIDSVIDRCSNDSNSIYSNFENIKGLSNWEFFKRAMREQAIQGSRDLGIVASAYSAAAVFRTIKTAISLGFRGLTYVSRAVGREVLKTEGKCVVRETTQTAIKEEAKQTCKITQLEKDVSNWLSAGAKLKKNKAGDTVVISKDKTRRVRFDFLRPYPHENPHMHLEELIKEEWIGPRIYPTNVPHK